MRKIYRGVTIEVKESELEDLFRELKEAEQTVLRCYNRLESLGVVKIVRAEDERSERFGQ